MNTFRFIFARLCLYLISGILAGFYISAGNLLCLIFFGICLLFFIAGFIYARRQLFNNSLPGIVTFLFIFSTGFTSAHFAQPEFRPAHYINSDKKTEDALLKAHVAEILKPLPRASRYILETDAILFKDSVKKVKGKILLSLTDSPSQPSLEVGNHVLLPYDPEEIAPPGNPFQFSYKNYLHRLKIERQLNLSPSQVKLLENQSFSVVSIAGKVRLKIIDQIKKENLSEKELAVFEALLLGERSNISSKLYKDYAAAGAIHILAISGLHIGILLLIFNFLLKPMERFRHGKILKTILLILFLWAFAILTGLSPSVVRAASMFSFIAVGLQLNRKTSTLNSIFVSLFFLLILNPYYIFQVGFQLSYLAVTAIVIFYPLIYRIIKIENKWIDYFWKLISGSFCAQIGILPLSLFYFHQFPGLFLVSNIVILPILGVILGFGLLVILLSLLEILPRFLADIFGKILFLMNQFVERIAGFEKFVFSDIRFSSFQVVAYYLILITFLFIPGRKSFRNLLVLLSAVVIFQLATLSEIFSIPSEEFIVFQNKTSTIALKENHRLIIEESKKPKDYMRERNIDSLGFQNLPAVLEFSGKRILIIDSLGVYKIPDFSPDIVILRDSPKLNLDRLILQLNPEKIVADASNKPWLIKRWKTSCSNKKIPFHYTSEKGAFIISSD